MAVINFVNKCISYYDSMGSSNDKCLMVLKQYLIDEHSEKKRCCLDLSHWSYKNVINIPQQTNGSDCGVFSCIYMLSTYVQINCLISLKMTFLILKKKRFMKL